MAKVTGEAANKIFRGDLAESFVEVDEKSGVGSEGLNDAKLFRKRIDKWRRALRGHYRIRMTIKSDNDGNAFVLLGIGDSLSDNLLVAEVNAIKDANGEAHF